MPKKQKPAIIMIHGFRGSHHGFLEIVEYLEDYDVFLPDIPGSGSNKELENKTLDGYADWLHSYIKAKKLKKPYIIGHSMGSIIVSHFVQKYPNDVAKKVVLLSPVFRSKRQQFQSNVLYKIARGGLGILPKTSRKKFLASRQLSYIISHVLTYDKKQQKRIDELHYEYSGVFSSADSFIADMRISMCGQTEIPSQKQTLFCAGMYDQIADIDITRKVAEKYNANFVEIANTGHLLNYEKPAIVADVIKDYLEDK